MNDYRITNIIGAGSGTITAIDEQDARRIYRAGHKGPDARIEKVELIRENVPTTKQQERNALETIRKIVASLGPQSYLATAFEGSFEDAENNIEGDAAYSMVSRWKHAEQRTSEAQSEIKQLKKQIERMELDNRDLRIAIERAKKDASKTITALQERTLSPDDEAACVIVDENGSILLEDVWNGFEDLEEAGWCEEVTPMSP